MSGFLLKEDGGKLQQEDEGGILLESWEPGQPSGGGFLLKEDGGKLQQEDEGGILLESWVQPTMPFSPALLAQPLYPQALRVSGAIGQVYIFQQYDTYRRVIKYYYPYNPRTAAQQHLRNIFGYAVANWQGFGDGTKGYYNDLPAPNVMTGFNRYIRAYLLANYIPLSVPTSFLQLDDTPSSYSGEEGKRLRVNGQENAVIFANDLVTASSATSLTLSRTFDVYLMTNTADSTVTLPSAADAQGKRFVIKKTAANIALVTIDPSGSQTIDGEATYILYVKDDWVEIVSDGSNWCIVSSGDAFQGVRAYRDTAQTLSNNQYTPLDWTGENFASSGMTDIGGANPSRITIVKPGKYLIVGSAITVSNSTGVRDIAIYLNGTTFMTIVSANATPSIDRFQATDLLELEAGDYIEIMVRQNSGGDLNIAGGTEAVFGAVIFQGR